MNIAIVTGASSGLGNEFAKQIDKKNELDEIWVIARREDKLEELKREISTSVRVLPFDLTDAEDMDKLEKILAESKPNIKLLVNSAGFGKMGNYEQVSMADSTRIIELNCSSAVRMSLISIPYMTEGSSILQICSVAGFQPLPYLNLYAATKAFLLNYSRALRWELFPKKIHVTAVCPYWIKDTEFIRKARETKNSKAIKHFPLSSKAKTVAKWALFDSSLNLAVSTPSPVAFVQRIFSKFIPHFITMWIWSGLRKI